MFPALVQALRELKQGFGTQPEPLSLKSASFPLELVNADWRTRNGFRDLSAAWNGSAPSWSGESVTLDSAQAHSVVWACTRIISESLGFMPLSMMQSTAKGKFPVTDKPLYSALHNAPNAEMGTMELREVVSRHAVLLGNGYSKIERRSGTGVAQELWPLQPSQVRDDRNKNKQLVYLVKEGNSPEKSYTVDRDKPQDILHIRGPGADGVRGYSVVSMARQSFGTASATEKYAATFYRGGGRTPYVLEMAQRFKNDEDFKKFRADWEETYSEPHKAPIMEPGMTYKPIGMSASDAQFLETRQFNIPEICRWFLVSPHLVGDLSRATFSNIEHLALEFVKMTLMAWMVRWEQGMWRCLLTPDEKTQGYYFKHNVAGLLRGDFVSRMAGYASALQNGFKSIDEVRDLEDDNPLPDGAGKAYHIQLNQATVPGTGDPMPAESRAGSSNPNLVQVSPKPKPAKEAVQ